MNKKIPQPHFFSAQAMHVELNLRGEASELEAKIDMHFEQNLVGEFAADIYVAEKVLVELKVAKQYNSADEAQLPIELKATGVTIGLLINFGKDKVEFKRMVFGK